MYALPAVPLCYFGTTLFILIKESLHRNRLALFYLTAITIFLFLSFGQIFFHLGYLGRFGSFLNFFSVSIGQIIEVIILTAGLVYRFNQYRLDKETLLIAINTQQVENTRTLMAVQEVERSQVANQLHDVAGSLLSSAKLNLSALREKEVILNEQSKQQLHRSEEAVKMVADMLRNLSHALSPVMLEQVGLKTTLEKVVALFNVPGKINLEAIIVGCDAYHPVLKNYYTAIYGIVYELLNNIIKHAQATNALLQITAYEDAFTIIVEDDGTGLPHAALSVPNRLGLAGIQSKISYFQGRMVIDNNLPKGLIITIEIPIII